MALDGCGQSVLFFQGWIRMNGRPMWCLLLMTSLGGCSWFTGPPQLPVASSVTLDELIVYSDFKLPENHRLLRDLELLRTDVTGQLAVPVSDEQVQIYVFKTPKRYRKFLREHFPDFPDRRAFFVETDTRLNVYSYWGDRIAEDLRHEVCHGYLHAVIPEIPLWLDEGLAEYFECSPGDGGLNEMHLKQLLDAENDGEWQPDLAYLEQLENIRDMHQIEYAEAWLWAHFFLRTTPTRKQILQDYLTQCRSHPARSFSKGFLKIEPDAEKNLIAHLKMLKETPSLFQDQTDVKILEADRSE